MYGERIPFHELGFSRMTDFLQSTMGDLLSISAEGPSIFIEARVESAPAAAIPVLLETFWRNMVSLFKENEPHGIHNKDLRLAYLEKFKKPFPHQELGFSCPRLLFSKIPVVGWEHLDFGVLVYKLRHDNPPGQPVAVSTVIPAKKSGIPAKTSAPLAPPDVSAKSFSAALSAPARPVTPPPAQPVTPPPTRPGIHPPPGAARASSPTPFPAAPNDASSAPPASSGDCA